jgi:hypothetical protein
MTITKATALTMTMVTTMYTAMATDMAMSIGFGYFHSHILILWNDMTYYRLFRASLFLSAKKMAVVGATTLSITTLSITTLSIMTLSIMTLSITTLSITTLSKTTLSLTTLNLTYKIQRYNNRKRRKPAVYAECCNSVITA